MVTDYLRIMAEMAGLMTVGVLMLVAFRYSRWLRRLLGLDAGNPKQTKRQYVGSVVSGTEPAELAVHLPDGN